jgi:hypothetical protein
MATFDYKPPPTLRDFMLSDKRVRAVRGPVGSAKSSACAMELLRRSCQAPKDITDGVRRSRFVISRNTLQQLRTTNLVTIQALIRPLTHFKVSEQTIQIRLPGVESDWLLLPLDTPDNVDRLLSLELTGAWISEFREIDPELVQAALSRCGRYPSPKNLREEDKDYWYGLFMETNSFSEDSPWYKLLEEDLPKNWGYFVQPGAFDPKAENRENLPPRYYEDLLESNTPEWVDQYIHNKISPSLSGQAVFRNSFDHNFHVSDHALNPIPGYPLIIGMDTGRNPAAVVGQIDHIGRLLVLASVWAENIGMENFLSTHLTPLLSTERFAGLAAYLVLDPACRQRSQIGEESVIDCARRQGYQAVPAMTNAIEPRLRAVEKFLIEQRNGGPAMLFDPVNAHDLVLAMQSRYRYKKKKDHSLESKPEKLHPWSDLADSCQYLALGTQSNLRGRMMARLGRDTTKAGPEPTASGWT